MGFPGGSGMKNLPANAEDARDVHSIPGSGRSPGERNGNHYNILAWEIPWTVEPGGLQRVRHDLVTKPQLKWSRTVWEEVGCSR